MRKRLGQHLLINGDVVAAIVAHAGIMEGERVFEIGPGTGNLTVHLLASPASVVYAVELDERLARMVTMRAASLPGGVGEKLCLVRSDFLSVPLPTFDVLVANIPYQISSPVVARILSHTPAPRAAILMFQKEFAERLVARPGTSSYSRLSVNTALLADAELVMKIGRAQFRPPPKVDSAVVRLRPRAPPADLDLRDWNALLRIAFAGKNKTLRALFAGNKTVLARLALLRVSTASPLPLTPSLQTDAATLLTTTTTTTALTTTHTQTRTDVLFVLEALGASSWRPNAMPLADFQRLYNALRGAHFRFALAGESLSDVTSAPLAGPGAWEHDGRANVAGMIVGAHPAKDVVSSQINTATDAQVATAAIEVTLRRARRESTPLPLAMPGGRDERRLLGTEPRSERRGSWFARKKDSEALTIVERGTNVDNVDKKIVLPFSLSEEKRTVAENRRRRLSALAKDVGNTLF